VEQHVYYKNPTKFVGLKQSRYHHHHYIIKILFFLPHDIAENSKRVKRNEGKGCLCVCLDAGWCLVCTLNN
jgi:hypothetical protein